MSDATVFVLGLSTLDLDALTQVMARSLDLTLHPTTASELTVDGKPKVPVLVCMPPGESVNFHDSHALIKYGHTVLLVADLDRPQRAAVQTLGIPHAVWNDSINIEKFLRTRRVPGALQAQIDLGSGPVPRPSNISALSPRESEIATLLATEPPQSRDEIAGRLGIASSTVKVHTENIRKKLGAVGVSHAALIERIRQTQPTVPQADSTLNAAARVVKTRDVGVSGSPSI